MAKYLYFQFIANDSEGRPYVVKALYVRPSVVGNVYRTHVSPFLVHHDARQLCDAVHADEARGWWLSEEAATALENQDDYDEYLVGEVLIDGSDKSAAEFIQADYDDEPMPNAIRMRLGAFAALQEFWDCLIEACNRANP